MTSPLLQIPKCVTLSPSLRLFLSRGSDSAKRALSRARPWAELLDLEALSRPTSVSDATSRIPNNISYFRINYLSVLGAMLAFSLLSHPLSLISLIILIAAWVFLYLFKPAEQPLILCGRTVSTQETLSLLVLSTLGMIFFTSLPSLLFSATLLGGAIICIHAAFRYPAVDHAAAAGLIFSVPDAAALV